MKKHGLISLSVLISSITYGQVGINTTAPNPSSAIDISHKAGNAKGFLPPRIALVSQTDGATIPNPAAGLIVYNTNSVATGLREGLTVNTGIPSSPLWQSLLPEDGVKIGKMVYFGTTVDPSKVLQIGGFEFRYNIGTHNFLEARLTQAPVSSVTIQGNRLGWVGITGMILVSQTWGTSDWSIWKQIDFMSDGASHFFYLNVSGSNQFYKISSFVTRNSFNSLIVEIY